MKKFEWNNNNNNLVKFSWTLYWHFIAVSIWLLGLHKSNLRPSFNKLALRIERLSKTSGFTFTTQYLKEALRLSQKALAGEITRSSQEPRVATRRGLPLLIPGDLRLLIEAKDLRVTKLVLTMLSVFRVMPSLPKLRIETITSPFSGLYDYTPEIIPIVQYLKTRYVLPNYFKEDKSPFTVSRRILTLSTAGPNSSNQLTGYPADAYALAQDPVLLKAFEVFAKNTNHRDLWEKLDEEIKHWDKISPDVLNTTFKDHPKLGKLSLKLEAAGKVRVFAIVDAWTQSVLAPLHRSLFDLLRQIPSDGTFDQLGPLKVLMSKGFKDLYSFDLSAATDRLPIKIQTEILSLLFNNKETATAWQTLLVDRDYYLKNSTFNLDEKLRYAVGQPMGALSSWAMLALTHHIIVQIAARRSGFNSWFDDYAILGDDVVIANTAVANAYLALMKDLGVDINLSKSLVSSIGVAEFAKKLYSPWGDLSPLGPKSLMEFVRSPLQFKSIFIHYGLHNEFGLDLGFLDSVVLVEKLTELFNHVDHVKSSVWARRVKSTYWDLVSFFGLNSIQDLSPSIKAIAIDSLDMEDRNKYDLLLKEILQTKVTQGWFQALEKDEIMYRKYRRFYSFSTISSFPSTQHLLANLSNLLMESASHYLYNYDTLSLQDQVKLAYDDLARISWALEEKPKAKMSSKALELSRDIVKHLSLTSPSLLIKVFQNSQVVPTYNKVGGISQ